MRLLSIAACLVSGRGYSAFRRDQVYGSPTLLNTASLGYARYTNLLGTLNSFAHNLITPSGITNLERCKRNAQILQLRAARKRCSPRRGQECQ